MLTYAADDCIKHETSSTAKNAVVVFLCIFYIQRLRNLLFYIQLICQQTNILNITLYSYVIEDKLDGSKIDFDIKIITEEVVGN